jgi:hypothetical protein
MHFEGGESDMYFDGMLECFNVRLWVECMYSVGMYVWRKNVQTREKSSPKKKEVRQSSLFYSPGVKDLIETRGLKGLSV